jgi:hypothetical protein
VKYDRIAVILINAIREQQAEIDRQRQTIDEQGRQLETLLERTMPAPASPIRP